MESKAFSIIIIPDTQILSAEHPKTFIKMTQWIVDHHNDLNIQMVLHLGDVVNNGANKEIEFLNAQAALELIDQANIPMIITPGNHDYDNLVQIDRSLEMFNRYFGQHIYKDKPWYGGVYEEGKVENSYVRISVEDNKFIFLSLEFGPRDEVLTWADEVMATNLDHKVIIITHCYMFMHGERCKIGDAHNPKIYKGAIGANDGEDMWEKSFKHHPNLIGVYSGHHIKENVSYRLDLGVHGNTVFQSFQNWQCADNGGEGRIRIMEISPVTNQICLKVFNPLSNCYETDAGFEVTLPFKSHEDF